MCYKLLISPRETILSAPMGAGSINLAGNNVDEWFTTWRVKCDVASCWPHGYATEGLRTFPSNEPSGLRETTFVVHFATQDRNFWKCIYETYLADLPNIAYACIYSVISVYVLLRTGTWNMCCRFAYAAHDWFVHSNCIMLRAIIKLPLGCGGTLGCFKKPFQNNGRLAFLIKSLNSERGK